MPMHPGQKYALNLGQRILTSEKYALNLGHVPTPGQKYEPDSGQGFTPLGMACPKSQA